MVMQAHVCAGELWGCIVGTLAKSACGAYHGVPNVSKQLLMCIQMSACLCLCVSHPLPAV